MRSFRIAAVIASVALGSVIRIAESASGNCITDYEAKKTTAEKCEVQCFDDDNKGTAPIKSPKAIAKKAGESATGDALKALRNQQGDWCRQVHCASDRAAADKARSECPGVAEHTRVCSMFADSHNQYGFAEEAYTNAATAVQKAHSQAFERLSQVINDINKVDSLIESCRCAKNPMCSRTVTGVMKAGKCKHEREAFLETRTAERDLLRQKVAGTSALYGEYTSLSADYTLKLKSATKQLQLSQCNEGP